jgi:hypothetical protein
MCRCPDADEDVLVMSEAFDDHLGEMLDRGQRATTSWVRLVQQLIQAGVAE